MTAWADHLRHAGNLADAAAGISGWLQNRAVSSGTISTKSRLLDLGQIRSGACA
jgi:hypothetical protein